MSIPFSNTTTLRGLAQLYEAEIGVDYGFITENAERMKEFTARVNNALDRYFAIAIQASGTWELDDSNHSDYPIIKTTLNSGQRDYSFTTDENSNTILDIYKVLVLPSTGTEYQELYPVDENNADGISIVTEANNVGVPLKYGKRANAIFLDPSPNYTVASGLKLLINRESSYFTYEDTTKKAGYPYHQEYFYLKPAYEYARIHSLTTLPRLEKEILDLEGSNLTGRVGLIAKAYGNRKKDEIDAFSGEIINSI